MKTMLLALASFTIGLTPSAPAIASTAEPAPAVVQAGYHHAYYVHYRTCPHDPCRIAGPFSCRHDAENEARHLASHGYIIDGIVCR